MSEEYMTLAEVTEALGRDTRIVTRWSDSDPDDPDHIICTTMTTKHGHKMRRYRSSDIKAWLVAHTK